MKKFLSIVAVTMTVSLAAIAAHSPAGLHSLNAGNIHYMVGTPLGTHRDEARRQELVSGQHPSAIVISCSDSRVPPELVFDQGLGDLFVVRTAGEVVGAIELGSIEYAVEHLNVPLIVVLGHSQCGAVKVAIEGGDLPPNVAAIIRQITPSVENARHKSGDLLQNAVEENVKHVISQLTKDSPIVAEAMRHHHVQIMGGVYDLNTGAVHFLK